MSPIIAITPVKIQNLPPKFGILSKYAKQFMKSQLRNVSFGLEKFFSVFDSRLISENEQKLKEMGFKQIGKDIKEGLIVSEEEYNYHVFLSENGYLGLNVLDQDSNRFYRCFSLNGSSDKYSYAGDYAGLNVEDEIIRILDFVEGKLFKARRELPPAKASQPFIPTKMTSDKIAEVNKTLQTAHQIVRGNDVGFIGSTEEELIKSINDKFILIQNLYKKISDCRTKYTVKSAYKNYMPQPVANKLGFKDAGPDGESITLFNTSYRNNSYTAISVTDAEGKELNFVISNEKKSVQKNMVSKYVKSETSDYRILLTPDYYTQKEVDESNLYSYLSCLNSEMEQFIKYTQSWFARKEEIKLIRSNYDSATLDKYKYILEDIHTNFEKYREKMRKYLRKTHKSRKFKKENNISTKLASTAVKFDNITPDGYDLRLSFPKVGDKVATQLLVMRGDEIENSFYIINNKLLRFNIRDLNDKIIHHNQKFYYYDNKYLQESNLYDYLLLVQEKLHELNEKLDVIRKKQIKNRIKYHIKTSEEQKEIK